MGFQDRRYDSGEGDSAFRRAMRRFFIGGDGFFSWSLPLFTVPRFVRGLDGIHVRVHILYILVAATELLGSLRQGAVAFQYVAPMMVTLFVLVLLHEFGHCLACRLVGGEADQILMWPLGGLAYCRPPQRWLPALITTIGGPAVNLLLIPILGGALLAAGAGWRHLFFNPLNPPGAMFVTEHWQMWLWAAYYMNYILLLFNVLVPMFPMDGGRILQELLWIRLGYKRSMEIAVTIGLVGAVALGLFGIVSSATRLVGVALFGGMTCYSERQRLRMLEDEPAWAFDTDKGYKGFGRETARRSAAERKAFKAAAKRQDEAQQAQSKIDRILDKIRDHGIASLSEREKTLLKDATERARGQG